MIKTSNQESFEKSSKDTGSERIDSVLDSFRQDNWGDLSLNEQKQSMIDLADYVAADTGNTNPPETLWHGTPNRIFWLLWSENRSSAEKRPKAYMLPLHVADSLRSAPESFADRVFSCR